MSVGEIATAAASSTPERQPRSLSKGISALASGQLITWTLTIAWTLVVPRAIGPSAMGILVMASAVTSILGLILGAGNILYVVREAVSSRADTSRLVGTTFLTRIAICPVFLGSVALYVGIRHYSGTELLVFYVVAVAFALNILQEPLRAGFQSIERMDYVAVATAINSAGFSVIGIVLVLLNIGVTGIALSSMAINALTLVIALYWARRQKLIEIHPNLRSARHLAARSLPYWLNSGIFVIYLWVDTAILSILTGPRVVGWYGVSTRLFSTLLFVPTIVGTAWYPRLVSSFQDGHNHFTRVSRPYIDLLFVLSVPVALGTILGAAPVMHALYGPSFAEAVPVMVVLAFCIPLTYLGTGFYQLMCASGRTRIMTWLLLISLPLNILLNVFLIRSFDHHQHNGALGSAYSLLITEVAITFGGFLALGRHVINRQSAWRALRTLACGGVMWLTAYEGRSAGRVAALVAGGLVFCGAAVVLKVVTPAERAIAVRACARSWSSVGRLPGLRSIDRLRHHRRAQEPARP
jgi:O-antigen/teichoic acid export membrane protein